MLFKLHNNIETMLSMIAVFVRSFDDSMLILEQ